MPPHTDSVKVTLVDAVTKDVVSVGTVMDTVVVAVAVVV